MHRTRPLPFAAVATVAALLATACAPAVAGSGERVVAETASVNLERTESGLLVSDDFGEPVPDRVLRDTYELNGDSDPARNHAEATADGLRVGVNAHPEPAFRGYFAMTLDAFPASGVYHARMTRPPGNITGQGKAAETVYAVQTASTKVTGLINFVQVVSYSADGETRWGVDYAHGKIADAETEPYWSTPMSPDAPRTQDITLRMDGHDTLTVWFGDRVVFHSDQLDMEIQPPFQVYLEVQAQRTAYVSTFTDSWVTADTALTLEGVPPGADVRLRGADGERRLAGATASEAGTAVLHLPPPHAHGRGTLVVTPPDGSPYEIGPFPYAGGDRYRLAGKS